jgi:threonine aldolase
VPNHDSETSTDRGERPVDTSPVFPPAPERFFASDNAAGAHPIALDAVADANVGSAVAYGDDRWTTAAVAELQRRFETPAEVLFTYGGTGGNVVALGSIALPHEAVICAATAHIHTDECGAPERIAGTKLLPVPTADGTGKLRPEDVDAFLSYLGDPHHPQPRVVAISNSTENGTVYSVDEVRALASAAHAHGLLLFLDGARLANAVAALGVSVAELTTHAGVDALVMGGTKAGLVYGEAVVFLREGLGERGEFVRKASGQLASKQRFIAAQFEAMLGTDQWVRGAENANRMAAELWARLGEIQGLDPGAAPQANALFPLLPVAAIPALSAWTPFWVWDTGGPGSSHHMVRWMTSWETTTEDVERLVEGVKTAMLASAR